LWEVELCEDLREGNCLLEKKIHKEEGEMREGERRVDRQVIN
jgi:hypothetical protein